MSLTPIGLFCFNRPLHTRKTIASLKNCINFERFPVYVFSDGPRCSGDIDHVQAVRDLLKKELPGARFIFHEKNIGLASNLVQGIDRLTERFGRAIIIEDDLIFHHDFLRFMEKSLDFYKDSPSVFQISGHSWMPGIADNDCAYFLPSTGSWGWGTWRRAWKNFDPMASGWEVLGKNKEQRNLFNLDGSYDYATMLDKQMRKGINSWAIRWYWSVFKCSGLVLYPQINLVDNVGMDGSGSHGAGWLRKFSLPSIDLSRTLVIKFPDKIEINPFTRSEAIKLMRDMNGGFLGSFIDILKALLWKLQTYTYYGK